MSVSDQCVQGVRLGNTVAVADQQWSHSNQIASAPLDKKTDRHLHGAGDRVGLNSGQDMGADCACRFGLCGQGAFMPGTEIFMQ